MLAVPALPALAQVCKVGHDHIAQEGRQGQLGHEPVQDGLRGRLVEGVESPAELSEGLAACGGPGRLGGGVPGPPASAARAASAADSPSARYACMRRIRDSSAAEYSRNPPGERAGCRRP